MTTQQFNIRLDQQRLRFIHDQTKQLGISQAEYIKRLIDQDRANMGTVDRIRSGK